MNGAVSMTRLRAGGMRLVRRIDFKRHYIDIYASVEFPALIREVAYRRVSDPEQIAHKSITYRVGGAQVSDPSWEALLDALNARRRLTPLEHVLPPA